MKKKMFILLSLIVYLGLVGCASVKVMVDYDKEAVFSDYKSFYFVKPKQQARAGRGAVRNPIFTKDVMREIEPIMESKGFVEATAQREADFLIVFYAAVQNRRNFVPPTYRVGRFGRVWRSRPGHFINYREGTLVIDMVDQKKKELVWQGIGRGVLDRVNPARNLVNAVAKVLEEFPPEE